MKFRAVELNRLDEETIANIRTWRNQDFIRKNMFNTHVITEEEHKRYIDKVKQDPNRGLFVFYLDGEPFGVFQYEVDLEANSVTNGNYLIDEKYQVMGYGAIMYYMIGVIQSAYLEVEKIYAEVIDTNKNAIRMHIRSGGILEGILKDYVTIDNVNHDVYRFSYLIKSPDENSRVAKLIKQLIEQEPLEDMLVL